MYKADGKVGNPKRVAQFERFFREQEKRAADQGRHPKVAAKGSCLEGFKSERHKGKALET
jgi:hypothetical protein